MCTRIIFAAMGEASEPSGKAVDSLIEGAGSEPADINWAPEYQPTFGWSARRMNALRQSLNSLEGVDAREMGLDTSVVPVRVGIEHLDGRFRTLGVRVHYTELGGSTDVRVPDSQALDSWRVAQVVAEMVRLRGKYPFVLPFVLAFAPELNVAPSLDPELSKIIEASDAYVEEHLGGIENRVVSLGA